MHRKKIPAQKWFNTTGPCFSDEHYMLPPERRLTRVMELVDRGKYFTLHAGRQTGKTTSIQWLTQHYNAGDEVCAMWVDLQTARDEPDLAKAVITILEVLHSAVSSYLPSVEPPDRDRLLRAPAMAVRSYLEDLAARASRPLVVFFDEADCLVGATMVSFLTQLRSGYLNRHQASFPRSVVLVGQRNVRDYVMSLEERRAVSWLGSASPFNVMAEATSIAPFMSEEVKELLEQHTTATGQVFEPEAIARVAYLSQGHPWFVNALADHATDVQVRDRSAPIREAHIEIAKETIILERRSHIDSLIDKLRDPRVRRVLDPMMSGERMIGDSVNDDAAYTIGLGIIRYHRGHWEIANPIYREVAPRVLSFEQQAQIVLSPAAFVRPDGSLDMPKLMREWQTFWRKDGHLAAEGFGYRESGPHLMLMAYLQRVINGGGRVEREYGLGRGALDLMIEWRGVRHAIEVKLRRDAETETDALEPVTGYLNTAGLDEGWLVMFDLRSKLPWEERLTQRTVDVRGKRVTIVGC